MTCKVDDYVQFIFADNHQLMKCFNYFTLVFNVSIQILLSEALWKNVNKYFFIYLIKHGTLA